MATATVPTIRSASSSPYASGSTRWSLVATRMHAPTPARSPTIAMRYLVTRRSRTVSAARVEADSSCPANVDTSSSFLRSGPTTGHREPATFHLALSRTACPARSRCYGHGRSLDLDDRRRCAGRFDVGDRVRLRSGRTTAPQHDGCAHDEIGGQDEEWLADPVATEVDRVSNGRGARARGEKWADRAPEAGEERPRK